MHPPANLRLSLLAFVLVLTTRVEFSHYDFVPAMQAEKIISAAKAGEEEEEE
jgi:hypothetical protein